LLLSPVAAGGALIIALKPQYRIGRRSLVSASFFVLPVGIAWTISPYWFDAVEAKFFESARVSADGRPFCFAKPYADGSPVNQISVRNLLIEATVWRSEYSSFHALIFVKTDRGVRPMYWSFKQLAFIDVPPTFQMSKTESPCKPVLNPLGSAK
jgi:hypothetical protein